MTPRQIQTALKALAEKSGSQKVLARMMRVSPSYLSDVLAGRRAPGPAILKHLGLRRAYEKIRNPGRLVCFILVVFALATSGAYGQQQPCQTGPGQDVVSEWRTKNLVIEFSTGPHHPDLKKGQSGERDGGVLVRIVKAYAFFIVGLVLGVIGLVLVDSARGWIGWPMFGGALIAGLCYATGLMLGEPFVWIEWIWRVLDELKAKLVVRLL